MDNKILLLLCLIGSLLSIIKGRGLEAFPLNKNIDTKCYYPGAERIKKQSRLHLNCLLPDTGIWEPIPDYNYPITVFHLLVWVKASGLIAS